MTQSIYRIELALLDRTEKKILWRTRWTSEDTTWGLRWAFRRKIRITCDAFLLVHVSQIKCEFVCDECIEASEQRDTNTHTHTHYTANLVPIVCVCVWLSQMWVKFPCYMYSEGPFERSRCLSWRVRYVYERSVCCAFSNKLCFCVFFMFADMCWECVCVFD